MSSLSCRSLLWLLIAGGVAVQATASVAADKAQIQQAISKGSAHLKTRLDQKHGGPKSLVFLALMKAGEPHDSPLMIQAIAHVKQNIREGVYHGAAEHLYEAAIDITLLADLDAEKYKPEIQLIANYIMQEQLPNGGWTYPAGGARNENNQNGDVSITQYASLGLWAAARAGIQVDPQVWVRLLNWKSSCQNADGGFSYQPGSMVGPENGQSGLNMTVNGVGTMMIAMINLEPNRVPKFDKGAKETPAATPSKGTAPKKETGALEVVDLDAAAAEAKATAAAAGRIPDAAFATVASAFRWVSSRFDSVNKASPHKAYYYYSLERMGALVNVTKIADRDWYNECADALIAAQNADGSWAMSGSSENDTCFAVLFLTRSTGKILKRTNIEPPEGGGLLSGGRGLPDDLKDLDANGNVKKKREKSSLDDLLASLQDADTSSLEDTQAELVQQIQLGDKKELIGKKDMLLKLAVHTDPEIRRTAIWAIGRTGDLSLARFAILGLDDPDNGVMRESHMALCWTARKPNAFKLPLDPLEGLAAEAGPDQKAAAVDSWRRQALRLWGDWYLRNRPYAERGDEFETNLRNRLLELQ